MRNKKSFFIKSLNKKVSSIVSIVLFSSIATFIFISKDQVSTPHTNMLDTTISQYSDKYITENAKETNQSFKNIAFDPSPYPKHTLFQNQIGAVIRAIKSMAQIEENETKEHGTWLWTPVLQMTPEYMDSIISDSKKNEINTIYLSIDSYLDIFVMPKGEKREEQKKIFGDKLEYFIKQANKNGIEVDAEAGWRNWAEDDNIYKAFAIVSYVKSFNDARENKFRGFQYDVEPYLLDSYATEPDKVLKNFVNLVDKTERFIGDTPLRFSVVIPDFYDEKDALTPKFSYAGSKDYTFKHLLNILDRRKNSSIILMSYRNFALGPDGSIEVSRNEIETGKKGNYNTKIIIAQETGDVPPPYITFHNTSKKYMTVQIDRINNAFDDYPNFGGIAIHYANAFISMK